VKDAAGDVKEGVERAGDETQEEAGQAAEDARN
jgi:hypothetical protein